MFIKNTSSFTIKETPQKNQQAVKTTLKKITDFFGLYSYTALSKEEQQEQEGYLMMDDEMENNRKEKPLPVKPRGKSVVIFQRSNTSDSVGTKCQSKNGKISLS